MSKRIILTVFMISCISFMASGVCHGFVLLTKQEALEKIFGKGREIVVDTKELSGETLAKILKRLDGRLVYEQEGSESARVQEKHTVEFYFGVKDGKKIGAAFIDVQPGKWGPVEFIIAIDFKARAKAVKVMSYQEKRGRPIAQYSFMRQYENKTTKDPLEVGKDITGISGATISSRCATYTVKKALVLFEELYLK